MTREAELLRRARKSAGLSLQSMASLAGVDSVRLDALENGVDEASTDDLDRVARAFGLSLRRFLAGEAENAPATILFRGFPSEAPGLTTLAEIGASAVLGEFLRCAADVEELKALFGEGGDRLAREVGVLPPEEIKDTTNLARQAEQLALKVRSNLGLGLDPIPSMVELVGGRLGVTLFWVGPDELDRDIDAACARAPNAAILINLIGGAECWWRTRMTLAHELCHLLFDLNRSSTGGHRRSFLFSPDRGNAPEGVHHAKVQLPGEFERVEQRANAFAAHFLAPPDGIKAKLGQLSPTSEEAVNVVCRHFQVGRLTAINQIKHVYQLSKEQRLSLVERRHYGVLPKTHFDAAVLPGALRTGHLQDLVLRALAEERIGKSRARQYLALSHSAALPAGPRLNEEQRAPLYTKEHLALVAAQRYLFERRDLVGYFPARVSRDGSLFRVEIAHADEETFSAPRSGGHLVLSSELKVLEQAISPPAAR